MVDVEKGDKNRQHHFAYRFVLRPNQSMSWRGTLIFFFSLCLVSGSVAIPLTIMGFWLILPFAGLELLLVWLGFYWVAQQCQRCEIIYINDDTIKIEKGKRTLEQEWTLMRIWAHVVLERCPKQWYPSRLMIRSHGQTVEIGHFLNENERLYLACELRRSL